MKTTKKIVLQIFVVFSIVGHFVCILFLFFGNNRNENESTYSIFFFILISVSIRDEFF